MDRNDGLHKCPECTERVGDKYLWAGSVRGSGFCPTHGRFSYTHELKLLCTECAKAGGICQVCGEKFQTVIHTLGDPDVTQAIKERIEKRT